MPEGPEVKSVADVLQATLSQYKSLSLLDLKVDSKSKYAKTPLSGHTQLISMLPLKFIKITTKGKKILFHFDKNVVLVSSLGMQGKWIWNPTKHSNLYLDFGETEALLRLFFDDTIHYGILEIIFTTETLEERLSKIGTDLLSDSKSITPELWKKKLYNGRIKNKTIADFLMEQKYFSGIGNYLKAEILYSCKISPTRVLQSLDEKELELLRVASIDIIHASYKMGGHTEATFIDPFGRIGKYPVVIYMKDKCPLGHIISRDKLKGKADRTTHWCNSCQR